MNRASPSDLRRALENARTLVKAGVLFVPMPVTDADDHAQLVEQLHQRLEQLEKKAEETP